MIITKRPASHRPFAGTSCHTHLLSFRALLGPPRGLGDECLPVGIHQHQHRTGSGKVCASSLEQIVQRRHLAPRHVQVASHKRPYPGPITNGSKRSMGCHWRSNLVVAAGTNQDLPWKLAWLGPTHGWLQLVVPKATHWRRYERLPVSLGRGGRKTEYKFRAHFQATADAHVHKGHWQTFSVRNARCSI